MNIIETMLRNIESKDVELKELKEIYDIKDNECDIARQNFLNKQEEIENIIKSIIAQSPCKQGDMFIDKNKQPYIITDIKIDKIVNEYNINYKYVLKNMKNDEAHSVINLKELMEKEEYKPFEYNIRWDFKDKSIPGKFRISAILYKNKETMGIVDMLGRAFKITHSGQSIGPMDEIRKYYSSRYNRRSYMNGQFFLYTKTYGRRYYQRNSVEVERLKEEDYLEEKIKSI